MSDITDNEIIDLAKAVLEAESAAITGLIQTIDNNFCNACRLILDTKGKVICLGMGKSGHIAGKIAATLASTGTPAFFVHPGEASHGDLGMITKNDTVIALSNSGETDELVLLLPLLKRLSVPLISITGNDQSSLAEASDVTLTTPIEKEACPLGLAPTSSTIAALAMGDALAISLLTAKGFDQNDFALSHPGGSLGRKLLIHVADLMNTGKTIPVIKSNTNLKELLLIMTAKGLGMVVISDDNQTILGVFTDGDLRRLFDLDTDLKNTIAKDIMIKDCKTISSDELAVEALNIMEQNKITALPVTDSDNHLAGILTMHDLIKAKLI